MITAVFVQARMGSSRLPGKVMREVSGCPMIDHILSRLSAAKLVDLIVLATSTDPANDELARYVSDQGTAVFRGQETDVLDRYYQTALAYPCDVIVRVTGDCPLVDPALVDEAIERFRREGVDYLSNTQVPGYPDGLDVEVFTFAALERAAIEATTPFDREHVTPYMRKAGLKLSEFHSTNDYSALRLTVDEAADLDVVRSIYAAFAPRTNFGWLEVLELWHTSPEIFAANTAIPRNEGANMGSGQKLWRRAKQVIPGGNMLLSKRAEMFLPDQWPAYFSKAKGCRVWDLDGRELIDMSLMGVGTNTLGYGHPEVDEAVIEATSNGNMSTLNCPEEVFLAEKLIALDPWAGMVRFARSGGEANAIAIRIARAAAGRDGVAVCGYHGWHDWYLSANLGDDNSLAGHLLPGLSPTGVPKSLRGLVHPFNYNDMDGLEQIVASGKIGVIKMEVVRNVEPAKGFLQKVRNLANKNGIVLVFDECTSGFRETYGGIYKKYFVEPDIAVYGKTLGNGYAITAVVGRSDIMQSAQSTFISSTFWTERIGPSAALRTLQVIERERSWERITDIGVDIRQKWRALAEKYSLHMTVSGLPALGSFEIMSDHSHIYKTIITQEMLKRGFLATSAVYTCIDHTPDIVEAYFDALEPVFAQIAECEDGRDPLSLLSGPVSHKGFARIN